MNMEIDATPAVLECPFDLTHADVSPVPSTFVHIKSSIEELLCRLFISGYCCITGTQGPTSNDVLASARRTARVMQAFSLPGADTISALETKVEQQHAATMQQHAATMQQLAGLNQQLATMTQQIAKIQGTLESLKYAQHNARAAGKNRSSLVLYTNPEKVVELAALPLFALKNDNGEAAEGFPEDTEKFDSLNSDDLKTLLQFYGIFHNSLNTAGARRNAFREFICHA